MAQLHVEAEGTARAPQAAVWALVADATSYCKWGPWNDSGYHSRSESGLAAVGDVRWFRYGRRTVTVERLIEVDQGRSLAYTVVKGIPVRNYRAVVTLTPTEAGTHVHWEADWDPTLLGRVVQRKLRTLYPEIVASLVTGADQALPAR